MKGRKKVIYLPLFPVFLKKMQLFKKDATISINIFFLYLKKRQLFSPDIYFFWICWSVCLCHWHGIDSCISHSNGQVRPSVGIHSDFLYYRTTAQCIFVTKSLQNQEQLKYSSQNQSSTKPENIFVFLVCLSDSQFTSGNAQIANCMHN